MSSVSPAGEAARDVAGRVRRLGLTGSIGAGKSTVAALLRERGLTVLDADVVAREVTGDPAVVARLAALFPGTVSGGVLDRAALAGQVFGNPEALAALNAVVHPEVRRRMTALEAEAFARGEAWVVQDIPLLFEGGLERGMDAVLVVDAPLDMRVARVVARSGLSREEVLARDSAQLPAEEKRGRATAVLENTGALTDLAAALDGALRQLGVPARTPGGA